MIELCQADKISYLANVFAICGVDGRFATQEVAVLKEVARRLNVTQDEASAARDRVARGHYELALLSDSRAHRDNLEDMVMAALADGDLQPNESAPIEKLAKALRFAQVDMDMIARRAQTRLDALFKASRNADKTPPAPSAVAPASSARAPLPKASPVAPAPQPVSQEVPAADSADAEPPEPPDTPGPAAAWPGGIAACVRCRAAAQDQAAYCYGEDESLNVWGCRLLQQPWRAGATWLKAGFFRPSGCFVFDREEIGARLAEAAAQVARCPHFDPDAVGRALAALPSQAWPGRRWALRPPEAGEPGTPLTVRRYSQGCMLHARQAVGGVAPVGDLLARRVIRDARRRGSPA